MTNEEIERRTRLFWSIAYLITFALWMSSFWSEMSSPADFIGMGIVAVIAAAFTFWFVGIGLAVLLIPARILINVVRDLFRTKRSHDERDDNSSRS